MHRTWKGKQLLKPAKYLFSTVFVALLFGGLGARGQSEISLLAPNPTRRPVEKILSNFQARTGHKVKVTYGGARTTTQRVAHGEPLDVSLVVAPVTGALTSGTVVPSSMTLVASYQTAVAVPKGRPKPDISTAAALKKALLSRVCANNTTYSPNSVCFDPAGTGGASSVRTTQKGLFNGNIDIGMLYLSDILPDQEKMTIVGVLPREIYTPTAIVGFVSTHANDPVAARALLEYLVSPDAQAIFREAGFEPHK